VQKQIKIKKNNRPQKVKKIKTGMLNYIFVYLKIGNDIKSSFGTVVTTDGLSSE